MSIHAFAELTEQEVDQMIGSISLVTVLIAGADGDIDPKETAWAKKIANIRTYSTPAPFQEFYKLVGQDYQERLDKVLATYPKDVAARQQKISDELAALNPILAKLENKWAAGYYSDLLSFAKHVATADGGVLGFFSVSGDEEKWINLPMINKIIEEEES